MKYYDWRTGDVFDPVNAACSLDLWNSGSSEYPCAKDPTGFFVFLAPTALAASDEYRDADPYTVEENLRGEFHQKRSECTVSLVRSIVSGEGRGKRLLDLGCGEGYITKKMIEALPESEICGLDYSVTAVRKAAQLTTGVEFVVADAYRPPYPEKCFDVVVCNNIWEHVPDPCRLLEAIRRITKPGGALIVSTPSRFRLWNLVRGVRGKQVALMSAKHVTEYTVGQVIEQMRFGGFVVEEIVGSGDRGGNESLKEIFVNWVIRPVLRLFLVTVGSHHRLDSTVFFVGRRQE